MPRLSWLLLFALQLPTSDPVREGAVEALATRLAHAHQEARDDDDAPDFGDE